MTALINIIAGLTAFQLLYFSVFLFITKRGKKENKLLLSAFLLANSLFILDFLLRSYSGIFIKSAPYLFNIGVNFGFLFGPLLYLYTLSLVYKKFKLEKKHILHTAPFVLFLLFFLFSFHFQSTTEQYDILIDSDYYPGWFSTFYYCLMNIQILVYMVFCISLLGKYSTQIKEHFSTIEKKNLLWLRVIVYAFFIMWLIDLIMFILQLFVSIPLVLSDYGAFFSISINFIFANYIIYKGLEHPELYAGIEEFDDEKYRKSSLTKSDKDQIAEKIENYLNDSEAFLNPNFTLSDLSDAVDVNTKYVSQVINEKMNRNFYELVNSYRVEHAKNLMRLNDGSKTILEILYSSGFNSKSVFNSVFKKLTGLTPTQYKKSV